MAVRLADLLAGLSRFADLGLGMRAGEAVRACLIATELARSLDLDDGTVRATYYTALLQHVGCSSFAHETAALFGDDVQANYAAARADDSLRDTFATFLPTLTRGLGPLASARLVVLALARGNRWGAAYSNAACEVGRNAARRLGLSIEVQEGIRHVYDPWRGRTHPDARSGDEIPVASRLARLGGVAALLDSLAGPTVAKREVRRRAGHLLDPDLSARFLRRADVLLADLAGGDPSELVLVAEPAPVAAVPENDLRGVAAVFADLADLKSPWLHGHSPGVAELSRGSGAVLGVSAEDLRDLELAGLLHDLGRVAVSNAVWEKPGPLDVDEWEQVRIHPYYTERILSGSPHLARLAPLAGRHHERLDGSGYHRGCTGRDLSVQARVLAVADAFRDLVEERPHRAGLSGEQAADRLSDEATQGRLDAEVVRAVVAAAGLETPIRKPALPAGLSEREVEVLRLVARGLSNAQIARSLVISRRTAEHHVQHVYAKIGVSSRAAAALFAMEHHLLPPNR